MSILTWVWGAVACIRDTIFTVSMSGLLSHSRMLMRRAMRRRGVEGSYKWQYKLGFLTHMQLVTDASMFQLCLNAVLTQHICYKPKDNIVDWLTQCQVYVIEEQLWLKRISLVPKVLLLYIDYTIIHDFDFQKLSGRWSVTNGKRSPHWIMDPGWTPASGAGGVEGGWTPARDAE